MPVHHSAHLSGAVAVTVAPPNQTVQGFNVRVRKDGEIAADLQGLGFAPGAQF